VPRVHRETIRVRYGDTDQMGVVYYANYLRWFEIARAEWLRAGGLAYKAIEEGGALFPVIEAHVRYRRPARYDDELTVECHPTKMGPATLRFEYVIRRGGEEPLLLAEGWTDHACVDATGRPRRLPPHVRALLDDGDGGGLTETD
jgi:acyl-CoA thioester hydrolase